MAAEYFPTDPTGEATGVNTRLFIVHLTAGDNSEFLEIVHGLGFIPRWVRVTPCMYEDGKTPAMSTGRIGPAIDHAATIAANGVQFYDDDEAIDLAQSIYMGCQPAFANDGWWFVEIGRTHSTPK